MQPYGIFGKTKVSFNLSCNNIELQVEKHYCTYYHLCCKLRQMLHKVELIYLSQHQHVAATCNRGGNKYNNDFQLAIQQCWTTSINEMFTILLPL